MCDPRKITNKIYDFVDQGILKAEDVMTACLKYMSEDDVANMARSNEFFDNAVFNNEDGDGDEDEDEMDKDFKEYMDYHGNYF